MATALTIGLLRLTDAAPVIVAYEHGLFAAHGVDVRLSVEPSWANVADKLTYGRLQAAVMLPPLAFAVSLGLRGAGTPLIVPMALSLGGNTVTVSCALAEALAPETGMDALAIGARLRAYRAGMDRPLRFAVVHSFSTHNLLLKYWLAASGLAQPADVEISVIPPAETVDALATGRIDGFCAGAPWGAVAAHAGVGRPLLPSTAIWSNHPEKCLAVSKAWADANPTALAGMMTALLEAARFCDAQGNAEEVAGILAQDRYLALDPAVIRDVLPTFFAGAANFPWKSHAGWFLQEMARWGLLPTEADRGAALGIYRPDLLRAVAEPAGISMPIGDTKQEGAHAGHWTVKAAQAPIQMGGDRFCDGAVFEF
ncbi:MAG TPA: CmpA/NrtA family ABC transporter substrate-binding protein [Alphaproteobacteria bacterium]|jgi:NitT/TauT family transport system ATP-binding protein/nitrate/nitrite transport system substrate-binding protein|nr:CmpA/NrtA family ABC transporter substrate-binding protein [Alphaproteobacteria bacterium]